MQVSTAINVTFQEVLTATDLSSASTKALGYAKAIARRYHSHLLLVHVNEPPRSEAAWYDIRESQNRIGEKLQSDAATMRADGFNVEAVSAQGSAGHEIVALSKTFQSDLIVVGTHGPQGMDRLLFGSTAEMVLRHADCAVMTVGPAAQQAVAGEWRPKEVVCALSLDPRQVEAAVYGYRLATSLGANYTVFHLEDPWQPDNEGAWREVQSIIDRSLPEEEARKPLIRSYFLSDSVPADIVTAASNLKADLLVLAAAPMPIGTTHFFQGIVPHVISTASCPVLTIHG
ncbi:MAG TPA: universal stress protein [Acidisarcina sp.]|nr:universal stress protein [Acidisarcina sp.]